MGHPLGSLTFGRDILPEIAAQTSFLVNELQGPARIVDGGFNLSPVTHNSWVEQQAGNTPLVETRDLLDLKLSERLPEVFALPEDRQPAQSCLESLETNLLKKSSIIPSSPAPFLVMVALIERIRSRPKTTSNAILVPHNALLHGDRSVIDSA